MAMSTKKPCCTSSLNVFPVENQQKHGASLGGRVSAGRPGHPRAPDEIRDLFQDLHGHLLGLGGFFSGDDSCSEAMQMVETGETWGNMSNDQI